MSLPSWVVPAGVVAVAVGAGAWYMQQQNKKPHVGDIIAVSPTFLPPQLVAALPPNTYAGLAVTSAAPNLRGNVAGYVDGTTGQVTLLPAAIPQEIAVDPKNVFLVFRRNGTALARV